MRRVLLLAACAWVFAVAPALAQETAVPCTKGWFWPFVRKAGDCLTDIERQNGQTGVYGNPQATAPQPAAPAPQAAAPQAPVAQVAAPAAPLQAPVAAPAPAVAQTASAQAPADVGVGKAGAPARSGFNFFGLFGSNTQEAPPPAAQPSAPAVAGAPPVVAAVPQATASGEIPCTKGIFWPFSRRPGDCLTDVEKRNGQTGVFGNLNAVASLPAPAPAPALGPAVAAPAPAAPSVAAAPAAPAPYIAAAPAAPGGAVACNKGWFWPFVRSPGDCLTDVEKRNGQTGVYGNPNAVASLPAPAPQAAPAPAAPIPAAPAGPAIAALPPAPGGETPCTKGWFWPFSRSPGDCLTDVEKQNGQTGVFGNPYANAPASGGAAVAALPQPQRQGGSFLSGIFGSEGTRATVGTRGLLEDSYAPAPVLASTPAAPATEAAPPTVVATLAAPAAPPQAAAPALAAQPGQEVPCTKGWFWPFSRSPGDCLTDVEKKNGQTGVFGNPNAVASLVAPPVTPAPRPAPTAPPPVAAAPAVPAPAPSAAAASPTVAANNAPVPCTKGWFWPFSRRPGDCLTDVEKQNGQTGVYGNPNPVASTPAAPVASAPAAPAAPAVATAPQGGGLLIGSAAAATPAAAVPPATPASAEAPQETSATPATAGCTKGWFWPFVRNPGDCPTDVERQNASRNADPGR